MSDERLKEIKDIMFTPHLDMYLSNICNELFQYVIKQKEVLDKIKEKINEELKEGRPTAEGKPEEYLWLMGYYDACKDLNELLEGIE